MTELSTPEHINDLIHGIVIPNRPDAGAAYASPEWRKWQDDMRTYYDRVAELRRQMVEAVPGDMPDWVHESVCLAWQGAIEDAHAWRAGCGDRVSG